MTEPEAKPLYIVAYEGDHHCLYVTDDPFYPALGSVAGLPCFTLWGARRKLRRALRKRARGGPPPHEIIETVTMNGDQWTRS